MRLRIDSWVEEREEDARWMVCSVRVYEVERVGLGGWDRMGTCSHGRGYMKSQ